MKELLAAATAVLYGMFGSPRTPIKSPIRAPADWTFEVAHAPPGYFPVAVDRRGNVVSGLPSPVEADAPFAAFVIASLERYPAACLNAIGMRSVVIGRKLSGGADGVEREVGGAADPERGVLHLINDGFDVLSASNVYRHTVYLSHELFHMIDAKLYGQPDGTVHLPGEWRLLMPPGGYTAKPRTGHGSVDDSPNAPGFLSAYAAVSASEDRAETFAYMAAAPEYVARRAKSDARIRGKTREVLWTLRKLCPGMAEAL